MYILIYIFMCVCDLCAHATQLGNGRKETRVSAKKLERLPIMTATLQQ